MQITTNDFHLLYKCTHKSFTELLLQATTEKTQVQIQALTFSAAHWLFMQKYLYIIYNIKWLTFPHLFLVAWIYSVYLASQF